MPKESTPVVVIRDFMNNVKLQGIKLIAGSNGLGRKISHIGILDWAHMQSGEITEGSRRPNELILISLPCSLEQGNQLLDSVKHLVQLRTSGLIIRTRLQDQITSSVITYANLSNYPLFILDDTSVLFEEIIIRFHEYKEQVSSRTYQKKVLSKVLYGKLDQLAIKDAMLDINYHFSSPYCVYYLKPIQEIGKSNLNILFQQGLREESFRKGNAFIPYRDGAFFIHSVEQEEDGNDLNNAWSMILELDFSRFHVGFSDIKPEMCAFREALMESYYACYCVENCNSAYSAFSDLGVYRILFYSMDHRWLDAYLEKMINPILEHDTKNKCEFWDTLLSFERNNGRWRETAKETFSHENTVRYRLRRMVELVNKDSNDYLFQEELLIAVKLFHIREFISNNMDLFADY